MSAEALYLDPVWLRVSLKLQSVGLTTAELCQIHAAREFAASLHRQVGQRYGTYPYSVHLAMVVEVLLDAGFVDAATLQAALLHDVLEDTQASEHLLAEMFYRPAVDAVVVVTDPPKGPDCPNRKAKVAIMNRRFAGLPEDEKALRALAVKLADRIVNQEFALANGEKRKALMYLNEHPAFVASVRRPSLQVLVSRLERGYQEALDTYRQVEVGLYG
ncbi:HD domain-containing protein [Ferrimonas marina]|uniref:HD domain-containing protein n=1 Tax=Ferrimonas marina TaxID=299255 RepID=UPI0013566BD8|nr:HD domain-containing protein [Ferrimonas marina]